MAKQESVFRTTFFSESELDALDQNTIPSHIAIVMDGNRRWARLHGQPIRNGHARGADVLMQIVRAAMELGVKILTVYAFSTENWSRSSLEVKILMGLIELYMSKKRKAMAEEGVRLRVIGDLSPFPESVKNAIKKTLEETQDGGKIDLVVALNYGARNEICRAARKFAEDVLSQKIQPKELTEELFSHYLDTAERQDPELLIRTSGEQRLSNFLLWQISYAEVYVTPVLWPDFTHRNLFEAILEYQKRERRLGE